MFFKKKKEKATKKIDKLVTGFIIGGAVASMIGLSQTKKGKEVTKDIKKKGQNVSKKFNKIFGKALIGVIKLIKTNKND